jgi:hypothetical protein
VANEGLRINGPQLNAVPNYIDVPSSQLCFDLLVKRTGSLEVFTNDFQKSYTTESEKKRISLQSLDESTSFLSIDNFQNQKDKKGKLDILDMKFKTLNLDEYKKVVKHYRYIENIQDKEYTQEPIGPAKSQWTLQGQWIAPTRGQFRIGPLKDGYFFLTEDGKLFAIPLIKSFADSIKSEPKMDCLWDKSAVLAIIYDAKTEKSFAFTKNEFFEIKRTIQPGKHDLEITKPVLVEKAMKQYAKCVQFLRRAT